MGLTIHYDLRFEGGVEDASKVMEQLRQSALDIPFKEVGEVFDLSGDACDYRKVSKDDPNKWFLIQVGLPQRVIGFRTYPGKGCEPANFGLCQRKGEDWWSWHSFCKTGYAGDPSCGGIENFVRCHLSVVALLDAAKVLGVLEAVFDEGGFWDGRCVTDLAGEAVSSESVELEALIKRVSSEN